MNVLKLKKIPFVIFLVLTIIPSIFIALEIFDISIDISIIADGMDEVFLLPFLLIMLFVSSFVFEFTRTLLGVNLLGDISIFPGPGPTLIGWVVVFVIYFLVIYLIVRLINHFFK